MRDKPDKAARDSFGAPAMVGAGVLMPAPDRHETVSGVHTCAYHEAHPGADFAGCTCSAFIGHRLVSDDEYANRREKRERDRENAILREADAIRARRRNRRRRIAQGIDARQRTDPEEGLDPKGESPVRQDAPNLSPSPHKEGDSR